MEDARRTKQEYAVTIKRIKEDIKCRREDAQAALFGVEIKDREVFRRHWRDYQLMDLLRSIPFWLTVFIAGMVFMAVRLLEAGMI